MVRSAVNLASKFLQNKKCKSPMQVEELQWKQWCGGFDLVVFQIVEREVTLRSREGFGMVIGS